MILKIVAWFLSIFIKLIPAQKKAIFFDLLIKYSQSDNVKRNLVFTLNLDNFLYKQIGHASQKYGKGVHSKHKHIKYFKFFADNIGKNEKVLDIGCGNGKLDFEIVKVSKSVKITGIDLSQENINFANLNHNHKNITYIFGDAFSDIPDQKFDTVILSNVLEHFKNRVQFLKKIIKIHQPKKLLIRVPIFERDWRVPLKKELKVKYFLDPTHQIEYTLNNFKSEMKRSGLKIKKMEIKWGEIWCQVDPIK
jgi:2-polyprenyl-3-methyl-5-hydroxy-6-metoxy-1,4-benzoquinol methylase